MKKYALSLLLLCCTLQLIAQTETLQQYLQSGDFFKLRDEMAKQQRALDLPTRLYYNSFIDNAFNRNELALKRADSFFNITRAQWPQVYA